jgi:hypothetical protein
VPRPTGSPALCAAALAARALAAQPAPTATVAGVVRDADTGAPVPGALVQLVDAEGAPAAAPPAARTRADGRFTMTVGAASAAGGTVRVTAVGFEPAELGPTRRGARDGAPLVVALRRAPVTLAQVVVTPGTYGLVQSAPAAPLTLSRAQLLTTPQIGEDVYRAAARAPGVAADDLGLSANFAVRGGTGDELYATLDGLELVEPFHLKDVGGAISILDVQAVGGLALTTGGFAADVGDRLTGALTMQSVAPRTDRVRVGVGASVMNARVLAEGGLAGGRGGWLASARRGYVDVALRLAGLRDSLSPRYHDAFAKAYVDLPASWPARGRVAAHVLAAGDRLRYLEPTDAAITSRHTADNLWLTWEGAVGRAAAGGALPHAAGAARADDGARVRQRTVLSATGLTWRRGGSALAGGAPVAAVDDRRRFRAFGLRQDWTAALAPGLVLRWGVDARAERAGYDYASTVRRTTAGPPDRTGRRPLVTSFEAAEARVAPAGTRLGLYVAQRVRPTPTVTFEAGVRHDRASAAADALTLPRLNVAWTPRPGTTVRGAWGAASQSQALFALAVQDGVRALAPAERAEHRVLGLDQRLPGGAAARVELYDRRMRTLRPHAASVGPEPTLFPEVAWDRVLLAPTTGRARGAELLVARPAGRRTDWTASYALAEAYEWAGGARLPRPTDQRHAARVDWALRPASERWRLSVAWQWHSGRPYTPTELVVDTLVANAREFRYLASLRPGALYAERLPAYRRLDLRWTRYATTRRGRGSLFVELHNALGARNVRGYYPMVAYDRATQALVVSRRPGRHFPRLPSAGAGWEF